MINFLKNYLTAKNIGFLAILAYLIPKSVFTRPSIHHDPSWALGLNLAIREGLVWGKDIVFTYGPLGYLSTGLPIYVSKLPIVLFFLFIVANGIYFLYYLLKLTSRKSEYYFLFTLVFFVGQFLFWRDSVTLYFYFIFHVFHFLKHNNILSLVSLSICSILAFYIKVNSGIVVNVLFILVVIYSLLYRHLSTPRGIALVGVHFLGLFALSFVLNTDLEAYFINSLPLVDAYNDAMVIFPKDYGDTIDALLIIFLIALLFLRYAINICKSPFELFLCFNITLFVFISFKQGFVRHDALHMNVFFGSIVFALTLVLLFSEVKLMKRSLNYVLIPVAFLSVYSFKGGSARLIDHNLGTAIFSDLNIQRSQETNKLMRALPAEVLAEIGNSSVDVLGWEISYVYFNTLKYVPRPIFQSYSAYHEKLIDLNYTKYSGHSAPDYVLYQFGSIDDRHPFWDEPRIYLALLARYSIVDTIPKTPYANSMILFKRNTTDKRIQEKVVVDTIVHYGQPFSLPDTDKLLYLKMDEEYTLAGKIRRVLFQPSLLYMKLNYEDGDSSYHRAIIPILKSGTPINKKVLTTDDAYDFFAFDGKTNLSVTSFTLVGNSRWLKGTVRVKLVEYDLRPVNANASQL